jgi:hypothetical protein
MSSPHYDFTIENEELVIEFTLETAAAGTAVQALSQVLQTKEEIDETKEQIDTIIPAINQAGTNALEAIGQEATSTLQAIDQAGTSTLQAIGQEGTSKLQAIEQEGNSKIQSIENTGTTAVQSVNQAKTDALEEIDPKVEQVTQAANQVSQQSQQVTEDKGIIQELKNETETAAALILDKANISTPTLGNILRGDGTTYEPINEATFLQNKEVFAKSYVGSKNSGSTTVVFDSFVRSASSSVGNADSGQTWTTLFGTGWRIIDGNALNNNSNSPSVIYLNLSSVVSIRGYQMKAQLSGRAAAANSCAFWWGKDVNNNFRLHICRDRVILIRIISGVETSTWTHIWTLPSGVTGIQSAFQEIEVNFFFRTPIFNETFITVRNNEFGQTAVFNLTPFHGNFVTTADIGLVGFYSVGSFNDNISNFSVTNKG